MPAYICRACGVQYAPSDAPPTACMICEDERQYVPAAGQQWTTLEELRAAGHKNAVSEVEPGLHAIQTQPWFAIGQRPLLVRTPGGNVLWDCNSYLDDETVEAVRALGGVAAISASHPHFYGIVIEWSRAFDNAPVYLPRADEQWIARPDPSVRLWGGIEELVPGVTVVQTGGHFEGSAVLHWGAGAEGRGALLTGDTIHVVQDKRYVTFMRSYPNQIPLPESMVRAIADAVQPFVFDRIYGGWAFAVVERDAKAAVARSAERYIEWVRGSRDREAGSGD